MSKKRYVSKKKKKDEYKLPEINLTIESAIIGFTNSEIDPYFDYSTVIEELRGLKNASAIHTVLDKHGANCSTAAGILHDLGIIPDIRTRKLKTTWSPDAMEDFKAVHNLNLNELLRQL